MSVWAILSSLSIPILIAIYFLRNRYPKKIVSSLLLWDFPEFKMQKGTKKQNFVSERSFWIELLCLLLFLFLLFEIVLPLFQIPSKVIYVLDNRYSLNAKSSNGKSVYKNIIDEIKKEIKQQDYISIFVADQTPELLIANSRKPTEIAAALSRWQPSSMTYTWEHMRVALLELSDTNTKVFVYSDRPLPNDLNLPYDELRLRGEKASNYSFISGSYMNEGGKGRLQAIVKCIPYEKGVAKDVLEAEILFENSSKIIQASKLENNLYIFNTELEHSNAPIELTIRANDILVEDDFLHFEPPEKRILKIKLSFNDKDLESLIRKTLQIFSDIRLVETDYHLLVTDNFEPLSQHPQFLIGLPSQFSSDTVKDFFGEVILEKNHPFLKDLKLQNLIWKSSKTITVPHESYVFQKDKTFFGKLLGFEKNVYFLNMDVLTSNFIHQQDWPILWDNIREYYKRLVEGLQFTTVFGPFENYYISHLTELKLVSPLKKSIVLNSNKNVFSLPPFNRKGLYDLQVDKKSIAQFYVNFFDIAGSNLLANENSNKVKEFKKTNSLRHFKKSENNHGFTLAVVLLALALYCFNLYLDYRYGKTE